MANVVARNRKPPPEGTDELLARAQAALGQLPDDAVNALASWWSQWRSTAGVKSLGRLLVDRNRGVKPKLNGESSCAVEQARLALDQLPDDAVTTLADWWNQWYRVPGYRRLGRLLLSQVEHSSLNGKRPRADRSIPMGQNPDLKARIVDGGVKYRLTEAPLDTPAFFEIKEIGGEVCIVLNTTHLAYTVIKASVEDVNSNASPRATNGTTTTLLLRAWADFERRQPEGSRKYQCQSAREDWGRSVRDLWANTWVDGNG